MASANEPDRLIYWEHILLEHVAASFDYLVNEFRFLRQPLCRVGDFGQEGFLVCSFVLQSRPGVAVLVALDVIDLGVSVLIKRLDTGRFDTALYDGTVAIHLLTLVIDKTGSGLFDDIPFPRRKPRMTAKEAVTYRKEHREFFEQRFGEVMARYAAALREHGIKYLLGDTSEFDCAVESSRRRAVEEMKRWQRNL